MRWLCWWFRCGNVWWLCLIFSCRSWSLVCWWLFVLCWLVWLVWCFVCWCVNVGLVCRWVCVVISWCVCGWMFWFVLCWVDWLCGRCWLGWCWLWFWVVLDVLLLWWVWGFVVWIWYWVDCFVFVWDWSGCCWSGCVWYVNVCVCWIFWLVLWCGCVVCWGFCGVVWLVLYVVLDCWLLFVCVVVFDVFRFRCVCVGRWWMCWSLILVGFLSCLGVSVCLFYIGDWCGLVWWVSLWFVVLGVGISVSFLVGVCCCLLL